MIQPSGLWSCDGICEVVGSWGGCSFQRTYFISSNNYHLRRIIRIPCVFNMFMPFHAHQSVSICPLFIGKTLLQHWPLTSLFCQARCPERPPQMLGFYRVGALIGFCPKAGRNRLIGWILWVDGFKDSMWEDDPIGRAVVAQTKGARPVSQKDGQFGTSILRNDGCETSRRCRTKSRRNA